MKARDNKGRFTKNEENCIQLTIPSLKSVIAFALIFVILFPWLIIITKFHPLKKIEIMFEKIMGINLEQEETDVPKKNILFY